MFVGGIHTVPHLLVNVVISSLKQFPHFQTSYTINKHLCPEKLWYDPLILIYKFIGLKADYLIAKGLTSILMHEIWGLALFNTTCLGLGTNPKAMDWRTPFPTSVSTYQIMFIFSGQA